MLKPGKLPQELLERLVLSRLGASDDSVVVGAGVGEDAAILRVAEGTYLVAHLDPITAAGRLAGWLAVHVAANDVAVTGARPRWLLSLILVPVSDAERLLDEVTRQMHEAAVEIGASIVGGHTEVVEGDRLLVSVTAMGVAGRPLPTRGARPGDKLILTKSAGLEGAAILAWDYGDILSGIVGRDTVEKAKSFYRMVSVVREALALADEDLVDAMHDPTEGGVIGGVFEMAYAARLEAVLDLDEVPVAEETRMITEALGLDPYRLISSGSLLAAVPPGKVRDALKTLEGLGVEARVVGELREGEPRVLVREGGRLREVVERLPVDEIYRVEEVIARLRGEGQPA